MAFHWQANDGPLIMVFGYYLPSSTKKTQKNSVKVGPLLTKLSGSAHGILQSFYKAMWLGPIAQPEASPTADSGVASSIPAQSHTFFEIDHEIISMFNLLLLLIQDELLSVTSESMYMKYWLSA